MSAPNRQTMLPFAWISLQVLAVFAAALIAWVRTSREDRQLCVAFVCALPFTAAGALLLDYALRVGQYAARRFAGAPPPFGGAMAYGALLGLALAFERIMRLLGRGGVSPDAVAHGFDRMAPAFGALVLFGRLGCLLQGCEYGRATSLPWAWRYAATHPRFAALVEQGLAREGASWSLGLHPTPLYEGLVGVLGAVVACVVETRGARPGAAFAAGALVYALGRFAIEALRADAERGSAGLVTTGQAMSLFVICLVVMAGGRWRAAHAA